MKKSFCQILAILLLSSVIVFFRFNQIPKNLAFDEVEFAKLALSLNGKPYIPYSTLATGHSTLYFYIILLSLKIFGITNFALRLPAAVFAVFSSILFYLILKKTDKFKEPIPFLGAVILATSHWFINFSRFSFEATFLLFLELSSILFLFSFFKKEKNIYLILSAIFAGLAFNSYTPGRIFFLLPAVFLVKKPKKMLLFLIVFLLLISPLSLYLRNHRDVRVDEQLFLKNKNLSPYKKLQFFGENFKSNILMFNIKGDLNGRHNFPGKPALNPLLGVLFIAGIITTLINWKKSYNLFFIFYFFLSLFPSFLTYPRENPHMLRTFTAVISAVYFTLVFLKILIRKNRKFFAPLIILLIAISSIYEIRTYFKYQPLVFQKAFEVKTTLEKALKK